MSIFNCGLQCECCGGELSFGGFTNTVYCNNPECLLQDKGYAYEFLKERADCRAQNKKQPNKQLAAQGIVDWGDPNELL